MKIYFFNVHPIFKFFKSHPRHNIAPLDIGYAVSLLKKCFKGINTVFYDLAISSDKGIDRIVLNRNDFVFLKPSVIGINDALNLKKKFEKFTENIFFVGAVSQIYSEKFLSDNNSKIVCGEWEGVVCEIVKTVVENNDPSSLRYIKTAGKECFSYAILKIDELPFPDHAIFVRQNYLFAYPFAMTKRLKIGYVLSSRGCPYNCVFCSPVERSSFGKKFRTRNPENIAEEMKFLSSLGVNGIYFVDDIFSVSKSRFFEVSRAIIRKKVKVKWAIQARVSSIDEETAKVLKKAGCTTVCMGVESGDDNVLSYLNKGFTVSDIEKQFAILKKFGFLTVAFFILGSPAETEESVKKTVKLIKKIDPHLIQLHFFTPYRGSVAGEHAKVDDMDVYTTKFSVSHNKLDLMKTRANIYKNFYLNPFKIFKMLRESHFYYLVNIDKLFPVLKGLFG